ncbi:HAMP domain-containing histidine kinase [Clostridium botulinum]|uniref:sensor histidine kinase n=1 Tax=Clostridium botulinum TaxID=1491 RepID=UPI00052BA9AB|nr:HAMP domain-containing sensor histidine kinase [Clostridium botulinum]KGM96728.1 histidine kinase [Clostridium botulinum D str. CCUG 7971]NFO97353.1 HAMP domain-containing histidine kinase [Clostridium botulinum]OOV52976.1 two-component sensor histidine kinase [Clostridium botulinum D/C]OOV54661.1 two-component sensor histidine kinase [Clostridium botulinum D/C]OOV56980.1 two-component sensor histidine kinase [Clostridium botulinum D/C]
MRKKGLFSKMVATYSLIIAMSFIILASFLSFWFEGYFLNQRKEQLLGEAQILSNAAVQYLQGNSSLDKTNDILEYVSNYAGMDILLFDRYGYVYAASNPKHKKFIGNQILTEELKSLRKGNFVEKRDLDSKFNKRYIYDVPVFYKGVFQGVLGFSTSMELIHAPLRKVYQIIWMSATFAIVFSSIIIYCFSQRIIIKPLEQINSAADKISKGEVHKRVQVQSGDEIGALANSFNSMAKSLEEVEENRRTFISNVSHELRSPITSIKGFIGGILDGVIPKEKENYYLSVAYEEIQRLTRLINDLLDLSSIEAGKFVLNVKEEDINEIIRLSIIKFETVIKSKKINVEVWLDEERLNVLVDRDKIIQVITNLIDNAIKYGKEEGNIEIRTKVKGQKVFISVYNDGPNISKEDGKYIWDRFYKGDKSRTLKVSTGLGLSIVRRIVTQHGGDIWFENKENKGITFTFTLKKVK